MFYAFSCIYEHNKIAGYTTLAILTIAVTMGVYLLMHDYMSISVPLFSIGVILSTRREQSDKTLLLTIGLCLLILLCQIPFLYMELWVHSAINIFFVASIVLIFTIKNITLKIPAILGAISFDLYLVHNKVLMVLNNNMEVAPLLLFLVLTLLATSLFYLLRSKILKI